MAQAARWKWRRWTKRGYRTLTSEESRIINTLQKRQRPLRLENHPEHFGPRFSAVTSW